MTPIEYGLIAFGIYWFVSYILSCRNLYLIQGYLSVADLVVAIVFSVFMGVFIIFGAFWKNFKKFLDFRIIER